MMARTESVCHFLLALQDELYRVFEALDVGWRLFAGQLEARQ
jgi:hypothetical protein